VPNEPQQRDAPAIPAETVQSHLEAVLKSPVFAGSERLRRFLRFLVEQTLKGEGDQLKEYTVGTEVFGRGPDYDPRIDSTVRVHAGKLRDKLREYYLTDGRDASLRIELVKGGYVPAFRLLTAPAPEKAAPARDRRSWKKWSVAGALALVAAAIALGAIFKWRGPRPVQTRSLVVLPFLNLSGDATEEYFSDGLTEEITNALARLEGLHVVARTSAFYFKGKSSDVRQIGQTLKVGTVLEGSVRRSGSKLRVVAQLVNAADGYHLWSDTYEREMKDVFAIQDEIAQSIARALKVRLSPGQRRTPHPQAYEAYLKGRYFWNKRTEEGMQKASEYFQQAIHIDPNYAAAYAGLADSYQNVNVAAAPLDRLVKAKAAATKALELDDTLAEAHTSLARLKLHVDWDWPGAEREFKRALELNPNYATAHQWYSIYFSSLERHEEARFEAQRARQLDPLSLAANQSVGFASYAAGRYDQALEEFRKALELDPSFLLTQRFLGYTYVRKRMYPEAIAEFQRARELGDNYMCIFGLGLAEAASGNRSKALQRISELHELSQRTYVSPLPIAVIYAALGEKDQAFEWLEKAYQERSAFMVLIKVHGFFDNLRSDPRYKDFLRHVGLPP